ncbi:MAG: hypothetical protein AAF074_04015 [Pseudomonadota bacterium]
MAGDAGGAAMRHLPEALAEPFLGAWRCSGGLELSSFSVAG